MITCRWKRCLPRCATAGAPDGDYYGRGCHREITELADTVSELRPVKHALTPESKRRWGST